MRRAANRCLLRGIPHPQPLTAPPAAYAGRETDMQLLETYKGFDIELNPHGLIIASCGSLTFPMICNSIEHARQSVDARIALTNSL